jgi:squalene-hopene/tetraprenyl-beta-curcumene cyclase
MNAMELVHFVSRGERPRERSARSAPPPFYPELIRPVRAAIVRARQLLLSEQRSDGSWRSVQTGDASLASQLVLLLAYLGQEDSELVEQSAAAILDQQVVSGGWSLVRGGPVDLSTSVQAYFALKLSGMEPSDERLRRAREVIRKLGGADCANAVTRFFLALLGQVSYDCCPATPPERFLLRDALGWLGSTPRRAPRFAGLGARLELDPSHPRRDRAIHRHLAAWSLVWSHRPVRDVGIEQGVRELFIDKPSDWPPADRGALSRIFFQNPLRCWRLDDLRRLAVSTIIGCCEKTGWTPFRRRALDRAESQVLQNIDAERIDRLDFFELIWHTIAIHVVGFTTHSPEYKACERQLRNLVQLHEDDSLVGVQLRVARVSDTISALASLGASGTAPDHPCAVGAAEWLGHQFRGRKLRVPAVDLANVLHSLQAAVESNERPAQHILPPQIEVSRRRREIIRRVENRWIRRRSRLGSVVVRRLLEQQNADGGWSAVPDGESAPDVTGAVLEAMSAFPAEMTPTATDRAIQFLRAAQRADGSWESATAVRLIHGTSLAVRGLLAVGVSPNDEAIAAGLNWILVHQQSSGGWGESAATSPDLHDGDFVPGPATASQTAWALLALVSASRANDSAVRRGIDFLLKAQHDDGRWHESPFVLRDAASGRWFGSELHAVAAPLLALSRWAIAATASDTHDAGRVDLRLVGVVDRD